MLLKSLRHSEVTSRELTTDERFLNRLGYQIQPQTFIRLNRSYTKILFSISALLNYARDNINAYRRDLLLANNFTRIGGLNGSDAVDLYYNKWAIHSLPVAINTVMTVLLQYYLKNSSYQFIALNHPVQALNAVSNFAWLNVRKVFPCTPEETRISKIWI